LILDLAKSRGQASQLQQIAEETGIESSDIEVSEGTPTINLTTGKITNVDSQQDLIAELAHAEQAEERTGGRHRTLWENAIDDAIYGERGAYETEGTIEYEAHQEIEPELEDRVEKGDSLRAESIIEVFGPGVGLDILADQPQPLESQSEQIKEVFKTMGRQAPDLDKEFEMRRLEDEEFSEGAIRDSVIQEALRKGALGDRTVNSRPIFEDLDQ
jgi:hypothetical protein